MLNKILLPRNQALYKLAAVIFLTCIFAILLMGFAKNNALASSIEPPPWDNQLHLYLQADDTTTSTLEIGSDSTGTSLSPALQDTDPITSNIRIQSTVTDSLILQNPDNSDLQLGPTSVYSFSLETLNYEERILISPGSTTRYNFRVPENWVVQDGVLELDMSYVYTQIQGDDVPVFLGDLAVRLNGETINVFSIDEKEFEHRKLRIPFSASLLAEPDQAQIIEVELAAAFLCEVPHKATMVIHPNTSVFLNYNQRSLIADLADYPRPFFQRAFEPDSVRFVLSTQPSPADAAGAMAVAAKLGGLTAQRLVISATTDVDLSQLVSPAFSSFDEHLIVVGQPQTNQILPLLNDITDLPVSLHERQLELVTQGPATVAPNDEFTYEFTVTNTADQAVDLTLSDSLPSFTEFIECTGDCAVDNNNTVTWNNIRLTPGESLDFILTLQAANRLADVVLENTLTLIEADSGPVNADTLVSSVVSDVSSDVETQVSLANQSDYFFVYDGQAVAKEDGVIQEIVSPWDDDRAILIITGLSDEAVSKASQAMSSQTRFPGMSGQVALVRDALSAAELEQASATAIEMTLEELGYEDRVVRGQGQQIDYTFELPYGWQLTDEAAVDLYYSHSQLVDFDASGLTAIVNREPIASAALSPETAGEGHLHVSLADADIAKRDLEQRLRVRVDMALVDEGCNANNEIAWLLVKNKSKIFLDHQEQVGARISLVDYPNPFLSNRTLSDLLFALPHTPTGDEWQTALTLAASLGNATAAETLMPNVLLVEDNNLKDEDLGNYHIIAIGRPLRNALIQEVNNLLPQPFLPGTDEIEQRLDDVILRLSKDVDLGYAQLLSSPWNEESALLVVTGTTDKGVEQVINNIAYSPWVLGGNLSLVKEDQVAIIDTRDLTSGGAAIAMATAVPELTQVTVDASEAVTPTASSVVTVTSTPQISSSLASAVSPTSIPIQIETDLPAPSRPAWTNILIMSTAVIVVGILAFAFWQSRQRIAKGRM